jgi:hypothetical protein
MINDSQGEALGFMTPFSKSCYNYFFTLYDYNIDYQYNPILGSGDSNNN